MPNMARSRPTGNGGAIGWRLTKCSAAMGIGSFLPGNASSRDGTEIGFFENIWLRSCRSVVTLGPLPFDLRTNPRSARRYRSPPGYLRFANLRAASRRLNETFVLRVHYRCAH